MVNRIKVGDVVQFVAKAYSSYVPYPRLLGVVDRIRNKDIAYIRWIGVEDVPNEIPYFRTDYGLPHYITEILERVELSPTQRQLLDLALLV